MPDYLKISELPAASSAAATDQIEANQSGTSRRLTVAQIVAVSQMTTVKTTVFVASGTWTSDDKMVCGYAVAIGGGGAGGSFTCDVNYSMGSGGGGAGATFTKYFNKADIVGPLAVTVGAGAAAGGSSGATSSVGSIVSAGGGFAPDQQYNGGLGGYQGSGDVLIPGDPGNSGMFIIQTQAIAISGSGGGAGGARSLIVSAPGNYAGGYNANANSGGGGGGAACRAVAGALNGGAGGSGYVYVVEFLKV